MPVLLDLTHTCHSRARTGVQRVARALWRELGPAAVPITHDPYEGAWRPLADWEEENLAPADQAASHRGARWPLWAQLRGRGRRRFAAPTRGAADLRGADGVIMPEIFSAQTGAALPALFEAAPGPRVALFHDALALQLPEFTPRATVARFPAYLQELLRFDGVAAVSEASRAVLQDYWAWLGARRTPALVAIPLGVDAVAPAPAPGTAGLPTVLCVATLEGRKNHLALLEACESLWAAGLGFQLRLIGLANPETGAAALRRIAALQQAGRLLRYDGPVSDRLVDLAYAECAFTVYPSIAEGFGLPVAESLQHGKPCLCRFDGALGEVARAGGCVPLGQASAPEIGAALASLLKDPGQLASLGQAARRRTFRPWQSYAAELQGWAKTLPKNA